MKHKVVIRQHNYTFKGKVFGITAGCWIVSRKVAREICKLFDRDLPRCGYDMRLGDKWNSFVTNSSNMQFRVTLGSDVSYIYTPYN